MPVIRVALDVPVNILFDYLAPDITAQDIGCPGVRSIWEKASNWHDYGSGHLLLCSTR